jgi:hypothetical protein
LGWGEVYRPAYHVSPAYFQTVNVNNTVISRTVNITNVYNTTYVNKTVINNVTVNQTYVNMRAPNAVTAMPQQAFASGQPSSRVGVNVNAMQLAHVQPSSNYIAPPVVPTRAAVAPSFQAGAPSPHPEALVMQRQVVAKTTPPPPPVSFQSKQAYYASNAGQPFNAQQMRQTVQPARQPQSFMPAPPVKATVNAASAVGVPNANPPNYGNQAQNARTVPPNPPVPVRPAAPVTQANPVMPPNPPRPTSPPANQYNQANSNTRRNTASPHIYPPQAPHAPQAQPTKNQKPEKKDEHRPER